MKRIILKPKIISKLKFVKIWEDLDEKKFEKALKKIEIKNGIEILKLNYIITKTGITLSGSNSLFKISEKELKELIKNTHKLVKIESEEHYPGIVRCVWDLGYEVIPLDNYIYVNLEENIEMDYDDLIVIKSEDIKVSTYMKEKNV